MTSDEKRPVLVLDKHRGIYFGYLVERMENGNAAKLVRARHCFYFSVNPDVNHLGVYGLATLGPAKGSKIGPRVDLEIRDISKIVDCEEAAIKAWEKAEWGK